MKKLTQRLLIKMIGLSILYLLQGCIIFGWTEPNVRYAERYINKTKESITLNFKYSDISESYNIASQEFIDRSEPVWSDLDKDFSFERFLDDHLGKQEENFVIELIVNDLVVIRWEGSPSDMELKNSPFNYNAWVIKDSNNAFEFTITDEDLE
jgi:hypothetical protein